MLATAEFKLLGSSPLLIPAALCLTIWMWAGNARRMALSWTLIFAAGLALVAASKIAYIGWGFEIEAIGFRGFSGHAMRTAAVAPVMLHLLLQDAPRTIRAAGIVSGLVLGVLMAVAVSVYDDHSASESIAGFFLGVFVSLGFIRLAEKMRKPVMDRTRMASVSFCSAFFLSASMTLDNDPSYSWLESAALFLSGKDKPYCRRQDGPATAQSPAGS